jgi:outer membrane protein assembly factor BamB
MSVGLAGCAGGSLEDKFKNPFSKKKVPLAGERIAVITDQTTTSVDASEAGKPVQLPAPQANASWSQPGGSPANDLGHLALGGELHKIWSASAGTGSSSSGRLSAVPLVVDGKVFTLDAGGTVSAFSVDNGSRLWSANVTPANEKRKEGFGGGLALDGGRLYAATGFGTVLAIDPSSGAVQWSQHIGEPIRSAPTAAGGKVYFVSAGNMLYALNGGDGKQLWTSRGLPQAATLLSSVSPAVNGNVVVAPFPAGDLAAFEADSGKATWHDSLSGATETSAVAILVDPARPVIDHGVVFAISHGGKMIALSESSGERLWTRNLASTQMPWVAGDTVYVVDVGGKLIALARADGKVRWVTDLPIPPPSRTSVLAGKLPWGTDSPGAPNWNGPVLAGGKLWLVSGSGLLVGADARTGQLVSQLDLGTAVYVTPVVAGGRMYILADNASLIALD